MDGEFLSCNAWWVWKHPKRALDALEDFEFMQENLENEILKANSQNNMLVSQVSSLQEDNGNLKQEMENRESRERELLETNAAKDKEIARLRAKLSETESLLDEQTDIRETIRCFEEKLSGFENVKRAYEERIRQLERDLSECRKYPQASVVAGNTRQEETENTQEKTSTTLIPPKIIMDATDDDWLLELPD